MSRRRPVAAAGPPVEDPAERLARRRRLLLARSARLRGELALDGAALARGAGLVERGLGVARSRYAPPLLAAGLLAVAVVRPSRLFRWAGRAVVLWPVVRPFVGPALRSLLPVLATVLRPAPGPARAKAGRFD